MKKFLSLLTISVLLVVSGFAPKGIQGYKVGDKAIDFKLKNIDSKLVSLSDFTSAKGFIVVFTCNHCPFAVKYEDRIIALDKKYASQGYPVVAINPNDEVSYPDDSFENMKIRAKDKAFSFPYLRDESQEIAKAYGALKTPHIYILKKVKNELIVEYIGAIDDNTDDAQAVKERYVENAINALLASNEVKTKETKAIGCGIKWKK